MSLFVLGCSSNGVDATMSVLGSTATAVEMDTEGDSAAFEGSTGEPTCVPENDNDIAEFDEQYPNGTKYRRVDYCSNIDGGCATTEFNAQTFAGEFFVYQQGRVVE